MGVCPFSFGGFLRTIFGLREYSCIVKHHDTVIIIDFLPKKAGRTRCVNAKLVALLQIQQASL